MLLKRLLPFALTLLAGLSLAALLDFGGPLLSGGFAVMFQPTSAPQPRKTGCSFGRRSDADDLAADDANGVEVEWMRVELQQGLDGDIPEGGCIPPHVLSTRTRLRQLREEMQGTTLRSRSEQAERAWAEAERFAQARARRKAASR